MVLFSLSARIVCYTAGFLYPAYASYKCLSAAEALEMERQAGSLNASWISWAGTVAKRVTTTSTPGADTSTLTTRSYADGNTTMAGDITAATAADEVPLDPQVVLHMEQSRWLTYWCVLAVWNCAEWVLDEFFFWVPFYYVGKVTFTLWMVLPQTNGSLFLYRRVLEPYLVAHESDIDAALQETSRRARGTFFTWVQSGLLAVHRLLFGSTNGSELRPAGTGPSAAGASGPLNAGGGNGLAGLLSFVPLGTLAGAAARVASAAATGATGATASTTATGTPEQQALRARKARLQQMMQQLDAEEAELSRVQEPAHAPSASSAKLTPPGDATDDEPFSLVDRPDA
ncbi:TB2/DP1, HVA22 family-domain-containing protein [Thamnocephalis sphaerospora]|uniref:Protein YOP1 n=1 Tax=Thamnocephalis sphaerospora TaxID=78915 RepID=A0A4P9XP02_9FUNG|nr:TB2/DP1, HVA22 family-domain-containing protein [Thamnocephalis sphaerospora]|eukprot:RKP07706.1 TB2/DP1, HVA22 family-domain-containing protein [Thamnocephalis sphaerospora]